MSLLVVPPYCIYHHALEQLVHRRVRVVGADPHDRRGKQHQQQTHERDGIRGAVVVTVWQRLERRVGFRDSFAALRAAVYKDAVRGHAVKGECRRRFALRRVVEDASTAQLVRDCVVGKMVLGGGAGRARLHRFAHSLDRVAPCQLLHVGRLEEKRRTFSVQRRRHESNLLVHYACLCCRCTIRPRRSRVAQFLDCGTCLPLVVQRDGESGGVQPLLRSAGDTVLSREEEV